MNTEMLNTIDAGTLDRLRQMNNETLLRELCGANMRHASATTDAAQESELHYRDDVYFVVLSRMHDPLERIED